MASIWLNLLFLPTFILSAHAMEFRSISVKFSLWLDGYYSIPKTREDAAANGYVPMAKDKNLNCTLYSYPNDPRVSILFDTYGNIAGLRTCYIKKDLGKRAEARGMNFTYDFSTKPMYSSHTYWNFTVWCTSALFTDPELLKNGGRNDTGGIVADDVYVKLNGNFTKVPRNECDAESQGFTKQACFIGMGMHYFYGMTPDANCSNLQGVFLLYECGELIGLGIIPFGSFTSSKKRTWNEDPPSSVVKKIVPSRPDCLVDWVENYGTCSIHMFFKYHPRLTFCIWPWQNSHRCAVKDFLNDNILDVMN